MTLPYERLRALMTAKSFLEDTANPESHVERFKEMLPEEIVNAARDAAQHMPTARSLVAASRKGISVKDYLNEPVDENSIGSANGAQRRVLDALMRGIALLERWHSSPSSLRSFGRVIPKRHIDILESIMRHCPTTKELNFELGYDRPIAEWIGAGPAYGVKPKWLDDAERSL